MTGRRGRPPRIARDIALLLAVEWHRQAERLPTDRAARTVTVVWRRWGRTGLGREDADSRAIYRSMRLAATALGPGQFLVLPGVEAGGLLVDAAAFFVPTQSSIERAPEGCTERIVGPCWRWAFAAETAEFLPVGDAATSTPSNAPARDFQPQQVDLFVHGRDRRDGVRLVHCASMTAIATHRADRRSAWLKR